MNKRWLQDINDHFDELNKPIHIFGLIVILVLIVKMFFVFWTIKEPVGSPIIPLSMPLFDEYLVESKEYKEMAYYNDFIRHSLFKLPVEEDEGASFLEQVITEQSREPVRQIFEEEQVYFIALELDGIIWGGLSLKSVAIFRNLKTKEIIHAKQGQVVLGWLVKIINERDVEIVLERDPGVIKILNLE